MKKKLQLNKEIVSILDRNRMQQLTKAGGDVTLTCDTVLPDSQIAEVCHTIHLGCATKNDDCILTGTPCDDTNGVCVVETQDVGCLQMTREENGCPPPVKDTKYARETEFMCSLRVICG